MLKLARNAFCSKGPYTFKSAVPVTLQSAGVRNIFMIFLWGAKHFPENFMGCETFFQNFKPQFFFARFYILISRPFIFISGAGWVTILFPLPKGGSCSIIFLSLGRVTSNSIQDHPKTDKGVTTHRIQAST